MLAVGGLAAAPGRRAAKSESVDSFPFSSVVLSLALGSLSMACGDDGSAADDTSDTDPSTSTTSTTTAETGSVSTTTRAPDVPPGGQVDADVVVIGAGVSGLMAARVLDQQGVGDVEIFEARDRVGGRTVNVDVVPDVAVEGGGQWVGPQQTRVLALIDTLGLQTFPTHLDGQARLSLFGEVYDFDGATSEETPMSQALDALAEQVPLDAPWDAPMAAQWDQMTVQDWIDQSSWTADEVDELTSAVNSTLSAQTDQVSFLWWLFYVHSASGFLPLDAWQGGAQEQRVVGGSARIALELADALPEAYALHLGEPVTRIVHDDDGVTVESAQRSVRAHRVIVAMSPASVRHLEFEPALPEDRRGLQGGWGMGSGYKAHIAYDTPFWREQGFSGMTIGFGVSGFTVDNSPPSGEVGVLVAFTDRSALPDTVQGRESAIADALSDAFGPQALDSIGFAEVDWNEEPWTDGCVSPNPPGLLTTYGHTLRAPIGRIHWAGTETAEVWNGYIEGGIRAGERAASEVAAVLP